jgi:hypothetical protein
MAALEARPEFQQSITCLQYASAIIAARRRAQSRI